VNIIALEEHFATKAIIDAWQSGPPDGRDTAVGMSTGNEKERLLLDLTDERIAYMDAAGIDVQVLSVTTAGVQNLEPAQAIPLARDANAKTAGSSATACSAGAALQAREAGGRGL